MSAATTAEGVTISRGRLTLLFIGLMLTMLMFSLNQTILATALPTIVGELHGVGGMLWIATAFMLASTIMMPIYGSLGDAYGRKPFFIGAIVVFMIGSVLGILAQSMTVLILARVVQGIGGGGLLILSQALIAEVVPARERGKYAGIMGSVFAVSSVAGPLLGGWFAEGPGWRWTFWINMPLGLLALLAAIFFLPPRQRGIQREGHFDVGGAMLLSIATVSITLVATWGGGQYPWLSWQIGGLAALTVVSAIALITVERRVRRPIMPPALFRDRTFVLATVAGMLASIVMFGVVGYLPTFLQMAREIPATVAGLMMIPMMAMFLITSTVAGFVVARRGRYRRFPITGGFLIAAGAATVGFSGLNGWENMLLVGLAILGLGLGMSMQMLVLVVQNAFPVSMVGTATASNNYFRQIGSTLGLGFVGSIFTQRLLDRLGDQVPASAAQEQGARSLTPDAVAQLPEALREVITHAYADSLMPLYLWLAPLGVVAAVLLMALPHRPLATRIERTRVEAPAGADA